MPLLILLTLSAIISVISMVILWMQKTRKTNFWFIILIISLVVFFVSAELIKKQI